MAAPQLLDWPVDQPLQLSGPPGSMRFPVTMNAASDLTLTPQPVALVDVRASTGAALEPRSLTLGLGALAGGIAKGRAHLRLDPATPPGSYKGGIEIGGVTRSIEINVVEQVKLSVRPAPLIFDWAKGLIQILPVTFENNGNVALLIDVCGAYPLGREMPITSHQDGKDNVSGLDQLTNLFAGLTGARSRPALIEVGGIDLAMPDGPLILAPGSAQAAMIQITVPDGLSATARFRAYIPIYIADLEIAVVTASKQPPVSKAKLGTKGAAS
jgi:hypothetical protein